MEILTFIVVSTGIIILPGPNVLTIVSTSIAHGKWRGLQTVAGTSSAMAIQLCIAALSTAWFTATLADGFYWLKWAGVLYLVYLGISHLLKATTDHQSPSGISALGSFQRGFWVSLTNPKTILFFGAFIPQFVNESESYVIQVSALSALFLMLATVLDSTYALLSSHMTTMLHEKSLPRYRNLTSGLLFIGAGIALAASKLGGRSAPG